MLLIIMCLLCSFPGNHTCSTDNSSPQRLVIIQGKATANFPDGELPATSETLIFQKVGCESCYVGTQPDNEGKYKIIVGDGKYKIIVRNPSSSEVDWLAPDQQRFVDTGRENSPDRVVNFDIKIKLPESPR